MKLAKKQKEKKNYLYSFRNNNIYFSNNVCNFFINKYK